MKIVITGGHLTPALAVVEKLKGHKILFIGRKYALEGDKALSLEYQEIRKKGIRFESITAGRLQRKFTQHTIFSLLKFPVGFFQAFSILDKFKPDVVLGFGGYISLPVIFSASLLRIPIVIHEQTLGVGTANKIASVFASKIYISWKTSEKFFPKEKTVLTGIPLRKEILKVQSSKFRVKSSRTPLIYITGGNLGSHSINKLIENSLKKLLKDFRIIHQTGDAKEFEDFERLKNLRESLSKELRQRYIIKKFLTSSEVAKVLKSSSLVISRAGINTISELIYLQKPALLIPLVIGEEQKKNAQFFKKLGLGVVVSENISSSEFLRTIRSMIKNLKKYKNSKAKELIKKDAAEKIAKVSLYGF